ncbi:MAG: hypothetical protein IMW88_08550 [Thermoflavifilum sp.]|nr:MAG: hypothetical protein IMW88_08550 [Thermoflavifilum sp.]
MEISVHPCDSDDVKQLLKEFGRLLVLLNQAKDQKLITITLKHIQFITPFLALFLSASINMIKNAGCEVHLEKPHNPDLISYLDTIYFETGVSFQTKEECVSFLGSHSAKSFLPILHFSASEDSLQTEIRDSMISASINLLQSKLNLNTQQINLYRYLIQEMVDNILQHACVDNGWLFAQYYPKKQYLDLCILDTGITILGSFQKHGFTHIGNHLDAIQSAVEGTSTKPDIGRGYGLSSSLKAMLEAKSDFILVSGDGLLHNQTLYKLPSSWQGTIVFFRIPLSINFSVYELFS